MFALYLETSQRQSALHATPLPAKHNTTPARSSMGHTHLSNLEELPESTTCWLEKIKQDLSPGAIWDFKNAGIIFFLKPPKENCQEWQKHVGSPKIQETQLSIANTNDISDTVHS
jgi:hypothetical protein